MTDNPDATPETSGKTATSSTDQTDFGDYKSSLPGVLGTIDIAISRIEAVVLAGGVLLMAANTISNVIGRFVFQ